MSDDTGSSEKRIRVLLVEDSEDDALLLFRELRRGEYAVEGERVYTAEAMEEALARGGWDLVISDHSMPAFDSTTALEMLHRLGDRDTPFLIVSGKIGEDAAVSAMRNGANDYFMKGDLVRLNSAIERELREAENRRERRRVREELRRSEERYRTFVEQSTEGIWRAEIEAPIDVSLPDEEQLDLFYEHLRMAEANDAMARMYGFERGEELVGLKLGDMIPREYPENVAYLMNGIRGGYKVTDAESREIDRFGGTRYFLNNFVGIIEDGCLVRVWGTQRDVTRSKEDEQAIREAEEKYRSIFENSLEGIYQTTPEGSFITANPAMARILGYESPEQLLAEVTNAAEQLYLNPERRDDVTRLIRERGTISGLEIAMRRRDGESVWVSISGRPILDSEGDVFCFEGTLEDISARREAEEALRHSEALYRSVVENATEGIFVVDMESRRIVEANESLGRSLGYSQDELKMLTLYDLLAHGREDIDEKISVIAEKEKLRVGERVYRRKDGIFVEVEVGVSLITFQGRDSMCVVAHDISERRRAEKAMNEIREAERKRISRDLHDGALHDLNFVLHTMQAEQMLYGTRRQEHGRQMEIIKGSLQKLRGAIYDLRAESTSEQTLVHSLESLVELNAQMHPERDLVLRIGGEVPEDLWGESSLEVVRIAQEGLANVRRHSRASRAEVSLNVSSEKPEKIVLCISDDGKGFDSENKAGVGLNSMRERSAGIGGDFEVESEVGDGTTITLKVPLDELRSEVRQGATV